jgi:hypothetical protein
MNHQIMDTVTVVDVDVDPKTRVSGENDQPVTTLAQAQMSSRDGLEWKEAAD